MIVRRGGKGDAGDQGRVGDQGIQGVQGIQGPQGGKDGLIGPAGSVRGIGWMLTGFALIFTLTLALVGTSTLLQLRISRDLRARVALMCQAQQAALKVIIVKDGKLAAVERTAPAMPSVRTPRIAAYDEATAALAKLRDPCDLL